MTEKEYKIALGKMFCESEGGKDIFNRAEEYRKRYVASKQQDKDAQLLYLAGYAAAFFEGYADDDTCFFIADLLGDGAYLFNWDKTSKAYIRSYVLQYGAEHFKYSYYPAEMCKDYAAGTSGIVKKDDDKFDAWLLRAAEAGDKTCQYALGIDFKNKGKIRKASIWLLKAAEQGHVDAMGHLGEIYAKYNQNYPAAGYWFERAAEKGNKEAQQILDEHFYWNPIFKAWGKRN